MKNIFKLIVILFLCISAIKIQAQKPISVVVAANLKPAMDSISTIYKKQYPSEKVQITYGASGKFYEQIINSAPFDVFFSADMDLPTKLKNAKFGISPVKMYAVGKLALWSKKVDVTNLKMNALLNANKIAIANPATAPYGAKAIESMKYFKLYNKVKPNLVYGDNIAQAAQFVQFGAADVGIIALSEALSPAMKKEKGKYFVISENSYKPLEQGVVILKHAKGNASAINFYNFISSEKAVAILTYFGYAQKAKK